MDNTCYLCYIIVIPLFLEVPAIEILILHEHGCMTEGRPEICLDYPPSDHGIVPPISQFYPFRLVTFPHKSPFSPQKCQHLRAPSHQTGSRPENLGSGGETVKHRIPIKCKSKLYTSRWWIPCQLLSACLSAARRSVSSARLWAARLCASSASLSARPSASLKGSLEPGSLPQHGPLQPDWLLQFVFSC